MKKRLLGVLLTLTLVSGLNVMVLSGGGIPGEPNTIELPPPIVCTQYCQGQNNDAQ